MNDSIIRKFRCLLKGNYVLLIFIDLTNIGFYFFSFFFLFKFFLGLRGRLRDQLLLLIHVLAGHYVACRYAEHANLPRETGEDCSAQPSTSHGGKDSGNKTKTKGRDNHGFNQYEEAWDTKPGSIKLPGEAGVPLGMAPASSTGSKPRAVVAASYRDSAGYSTPDNPINNPAHFQGNPILQHANPQGITEPSYINLDDIGLDAGYASIGDTAQGGKTAPAITPKPASKTVSMIKENHLRIYLPF
jgi:hypothetical protein